ncbi:MAG: phosphoenolpyruvate--protein phosphotransferase [Bacteroidota bacterium]
MIVMISIVLVSHSRKLAEGVKELALQMSQHKVKLEAVGGIETEGKIDIGTDPEAILKAISKLGKEGEVLVLMDIGSAIMSAELAKEMLLPEIEEKVYLCEAPLVEGAIAACTQAMIGASIESVIAEAKNALIGKTSLLTPREQVAQPRSELLSETTVYESFDLLVPNILGLHARPAVRLVEIVSRFEVNATVSTSKENFVSAKSISQIGTLGAKQGDTLHFRIAGQDSELLITALKKFQKDNFGDSKRDEQAAKKSSKLAVSVVETSDSNGVIQGIAASRGIAIGKAKVIKNNLPTVIKENVSDSDSEVEKLETALQKVIRQFKATQATLQVAKKEEAQIFEFHILFLEDRGFLQKVIQSIQSEKINAAYAWKENMEQIKQQYLKMNTTYLQERIADITEIGNKVLLELIGFKQEDIQPEKPSILVIEELGPAQTINLDKSKVLGIVTAKGGDTSHSAILSRSLGIPAIVGIGNAIDRIQNGEEVAIDGTIGTIWIGNQQVETLQRIREQKKLETQRAQQLLIKAQEPAITKNYKQISILANVSSPEEAKLAYQNGAEGIGLYRTEFLYMNRNEAPSETEQYEVYRSVAANMQGYPVTIRTLDVGGDKPIPYLKIPEEKNPFLGLRGARYCLQNTDLFKTQLRAICRVSAESPVRVMFPMIGVLEEVMAAKEILKEVQIELKKEQIPFNPEMPVGIMIEIPSIVFLLDNLSKELDFLSIGTNDLTQYLLATDRENETVAKYRSALHPTVLRALQYILANSEIEVGMCGELAGNPLATNLLLAFGLEKFSMNSPVIPSIKEIIRHFDSAENELLIAQFEQLDSLSKVKNLLKQNQPLLV